MRIFDCSISTKFFWALMLCGLLLLLPGCGGCTGDRVSKTPEEEKAEKEAEEKKRKEEKKPDYELSELIVKPNDPGVDDDDRNENDTRIEASRLKFGYVKPGHWTTGSLPAIANNDDFQGNLVARCKDPSGNQIPTEKTKYLLTVTRPVSLPKGQKKRIEAAWYVPRREGRSTGQVQLEHELQTRSGKLVESRTQGGILMPDYQYYMVVLSTAPAGFKYIELLDSVKAEAGLEDGSNLIFYRVTFPTIRQEVPLPDHSLNWTSIAYLIWDDLDPSLLSPDQQQAMVDWLHFGGQLIVNGPEGFAKLQNSFLDEYLPVAEGDVVNLTGDDLEAMNEYWSIPASPKRVFQDRKKEKPKAIPLGKRRMTVTEETSPIGLRMVLSDRGKFMKNTGELVAEGRVGRGRIVIAGFSLENRQIINWQSWDGFFNCCLLRRPAKYFIETQYEELLLRWQDQSGAIRDPLQSTTLRYISRDLGAKGTPNTLVPRDSPAEDLMFEDIQDVEDVEINEGNSGITFSYPGNVYPPEINRDDGVRKLSTDNWHYGGFRNSAQSGAAGWNDFSGISTAARSALKESSGIIPPSSGFVLRVLAGYLVVLVPLNWLVFRLLGRLEWAWIAAPIIAIGGAILVVKLASLDIGFARSRTEVAVYEMYAGHSRGHLTRYTALYTSLSSNYEMEFEEGTTQAQPFAIDPYGSDNKNEVESEVEFRREDNWILKSFRVQSNSTAFLHSEQMHDVGGSFALNVTEGDRYRLVNTTGLDLHDVGILRRDEDGRLWNCWLGDLSANAKETSVDFATADKDNAKFEQWRDSATAESVASIAERLFAEHDTNEDNMLSRKEVTDLENVARVFELVDIKGGDGKPDNKLSIDEFVDCLKTYGASDEVSLGAVFDMVSKHLKLANGEARLIGWTSSTLSGMKIKPTASQSTNKTFVLVHLHQGELVEPTPDTNTRFDFARETREKF